MLFSNSLASRTLPVLNIHPKRPRHGLNCANWPILEVTAGSQKDTARVSLGAISLSSSGHFPPKPYSKCVNPVTLPPGCDMLATKPALTGSATIKHDRHSTGHLLQGGHSRGAARQR